MSGHSKWANIKHRKGAQDKKRSKIFTKILKEITIAARIGGSDPSGNAALRLALQNARGANIPKDTTDRAIKKGAGGEGETFENLNYEAYGPGGVGVFIETSTDNPNRTVANIRSILFKNDGSLGTNGSLSFVFEQKGVFLLDKESLIGKNMETLEMDLIDGGADDIEIHEENMTIYTPLAEFGNMQRKLEELNLEAKEATLQRIPLNTKKLDVKDAQKVLKLIEKLEDDDDVQTVYHNLELTDELIELLEEK